MSIRQLPTRSVQPQESSAPCLCARDPHHPTWGTDKISEEEVCDCLQWHQHVEKPPQEDYGVLFEPPHGAPSILNSTMRLVWAQRLDPNKISLGKKKISLQILHCLLVQVDISVPQKRRRREIWKSKNILIIQNPNISFRRASLFCWEKTETEFETAKLLQNWHKINIPLFSYSSNTTVMLCWLHLNHPFLLILNTPSPCPCF